MLSVIPDKQILTALELLLHLIQDVQVSCLVYPIFGDRLGGK
jgi:hypothetical protein